MDDRTATILDVLRALPAQTFAVTMRHPSRSADRTFVGATLFDYAVAAGLFPAKMGGGAMADGYLVVTAEDDVRVVVALAEVWPTMTDKRVFLAYEQDGEALRNGVRLVCDGDYLSGRSLGGIVSVELHHVGRSAVEAREPGQVVVGGLLDRPVTLDAANLRERPPIEVITVAATGHGGQPISPRVYVGPRLYDVLESAGIRLDPAVNEAFLSKIVVATSADGHAAVIAGAEIEPRFMNGDVIVTVEVDGALRLMVPFDRKPGRWAKDLVSIELREG